MSAVTVSQETIDPKTAATILAANDHNRGMREGLVLSISRDIAEGRWFLNGESIKLTADGKLIDGQHRLAAVVMADKPITTVVVRGLEMSVQDTIDTGAKRTFSDILALRGQHYYTQLASMVRFAWLMDITGHPNSGRIQPTTTELEGYLAANPTINDWLMTARQTTDSVMHLPGSVSGGWGFLMARFGEEDAREFWRSMLENDAPKGSAPAVLREQLIKDRLASHPSNVVHRAALVGKAWNHWMDGKDPIVIGWRPGVEDFPKIHGRTK